MLGFSVTIHLIPNARGHTFDEVTTALREAGLLERESELVGMTTDPSGPTLASFMISVSGHSLEHLVAHGLAGFVGTGGYPDRYWTRLGDARQNIDSTQLVESPAAEVAADEWVLIELWDQS